MLNCFYKIKNYTTFNAVDAISTSKQHNDKIEFIIDNKIHKYDYTKRPKYSLEYLEIENAKRIYSKNNLCRIVYSGGSDSHSVATAFVKAGIIAKYTLFTYHNLYDYTYDSKKYESIKIEKLNKLHKFYNLLNPEIELIDIDKKKIDDFFIKDYFLNSSYFGGNKSFNYNDISDTLKYSKFDPTKYCNIFGIEKPRLDYDDKGIYWTVNDDMCMYTNGIKYNSEWFYMSPEAIELINAQCWSVLDYIARKKPINFLLALRNIHDKKNYHEWCYAMGRNVDVEQTFLSIYSKINKDYNYYNHIDYYKGSNQIKKYNDLINILNDYEIKISDFKVKTQKHYLMRF